MENLEAQQERINAEFRLTSARIIELTRHFSVCGNECTPETCAYKAYKAGDK